MTNKLHKDLLIKYCIEIKDARQRIRQIGNRQIGNEPISLAESKQQAVEELERAFDEIVKE